MKLQTDKGLIRIGSSAFRRLVGDAVTSCFVVRGMAMRSKADGLVHLLKRESMDKGVYITNLDDTTVSIDLHIIVRQGVNIPVVCSSIIREVTYKVTKETGVNIDSVNVYVDSIVLN
ncbi:MAG: Asp23/Gls24 family envelope stress response protein [Oscillospiraceae bacterium]|nr:Asp23/Gls24 family envelope stress response protein [Oscillospiraceae bacterium]